MRSFKQFVKDVDLDFKVLMLCVLCCIFYLESLGLLKSLFVGSGRIKADCLNLLVEMIMI